MDSQVKPSGSARQTHDIYNQHLTTPALYIKELQGATSYVRIVSFSYITGYIKIGTYQVVGYDAIPVQKKLVTLI
ncbi:MAG: hypothetical protein A3K00_07680 [Gallionellales bacterium RIFOXYD2_FULL_52_7]|nr:MAG: hypothetical protein A3K00_07680 [Gallionellales bacterium RIFOXYD2_FULL_52_7]